MQTPALMATNITRRRFTALAGTAIASVAFGASCALDVIADQERARITARPKRGVKTRAQGTAPLRLGGSRDGILRMPSKPAAGPLPLLVLLHGASGMGERQLARFNTLPDDAGLVVLAPDSRMGTWDAIQSVFSVDVEFLNEALTHVFDMVDVDPNRLSIGGFSDGATYALSLGLANGDVFKKILAFSPGFIVPVAPIGRPRIFISHGTQDDILPIDRCSRVIVPKLQADGYSVTFREFPGGHLVPPEVAAEGLAWAAKA
jgi:phospholipase/carboxylesterase